MQPGLLADTFLDLPQAYASIKAPDAIWPTDNDYGIPVLDPTMQADAIDAPIVVWGEQARSIQRHGGTCLFYTDDSRFEALWRRPGPVLQAGFITACEPNFSVYDDAPMVVALWQTYRKRWIARWWQSQGIRIIVDLNVSIYHAEINRLGIPQGWRAFATRGYSDRLNEVLDEFAIAQGIAGAKSVLFTVYGGGAKVRELCQHNGWLWIPERADRTKGKYNG